MSMMVQVRHVPEGLVAVLKERAAAERLSLSDFLLARLEEFAAEPTLDHVLDRLTTRPRRELGVSAAELLDQARHS